MPPRSPACAVRRDPEHPGACVPRMAPGCVCRDRWCWELALTSACVPTAAAWELGVGRSSRPGNIDISVRGAGWQAEFIDEGRQPDGIHNRNRVIDLDGVLSSRTRLAWFADVGITSSLLSRNGSGNGYAASGPMLGYDAGAGVQWRLTRGWRLRVQTLWLHYPQCSSDAPENFAYTSVSLVREWP